MKLVTFPKDVVMKMVKANDFRSDFDFFEKALNYAKITKDEDVKKALVEAGIETNSWKQKYFLERKKIEVVMKAL